MKLLSIIAGFAGGAAAGFGIAAAVCHSISRASPSSAVAPASFAADPPPKPFNPPKATTIPGLIDEFQAKDGKIPPLNIVGWRIGTPASLRLIDAMLAELKSRQGSGNDLQARLWLAERFGVGGDLLSLSRLAYGLDSARADACMQAIERTSGRPLANLFGQAVLETEFVRDPVAGVRLMKKFSDEGRFGDAPLPRDLRDWSFPAASEQISRSSVLGRAGWDLARLQAPEAISFLTGPDVPASDRPEFVKEWLSFLPVAAYSQVADALVAAQWPLDVAAPFSREWSDHNPAEATDWMLRSSLKGESRDLLENAVLIAWEVKDPQEGLAHVFPRRTEFHTRDLVADLLNRCLHGPPSILAHYVESLPAGKDRDDLIVAVQTSLDASEGRNSDPEDRKPAKSEGIFGFDPAPLRALKDLISDPATKASMQTPTPIERR